MTVTITPTGGALGAQVSDIDLRAPLDEETVGRIRAAFLAHSLLLIRSQQISKDDQVRFSRCFGEPVPHPTNTRDRDPQVPEITVISNIVEAGQAVGALGNDEVAFHADLVFLHEPGSVSILYCVETPTEGGNTFWTNGYAAYDALDPATKAKIEDVKAVYVHRNPAYNPPTPPQHPLVCIHPESGRPTLFISPSSAERVVGMDETEGRQLLDDLFAHAIQPRFVWEHSWQPGDLIVWDNRCTMHRRESFDNSQRRLMLRTQLLGPVTKEP